MSHKCSIPALCATPRTCGDNHESRGPRPRCGKTYRPSRASEQSIRVCNLPERHADACGEEAS